MLFRSEKMETTEKLVQRVQFHLLPHQDLQDHKDQKVKLVQRDQQVQMVQMDQQVQLVLQDLPAHKVHRELTEQMVLMVHKVQKVTPVQVE